MFSRLRCHFCGSKQPHTKSTREFKCSECEAVNYLDGKGNIIDTPAAVASRTSPPPKSYTRSLPETLDHQQNQAFCRTCLQNQHMYNETLANYLPEESHPQYREFEAALPAYKKGLEQRYPLICKRCAPIAQDKINRADYYGLTQNFRRLAAVTKARDGRPLPRSRDDWGKKSMRIFLNVVSFALWLSLLAQVAWHTYGILTIIFATSSSEPNLADFADNLDRPLWQECARQATKLRFSHTCYNYSGTFVIYALAVTLVGLWYNPGLKAWYHHTHRIEAVKGQGNYFFVQLVVLAIRSGTWITLSNRYAIHHFDKQHLIAMHAFAIFFMVVGAMIANRNIKPVTWKMKGKMMPKPEEQDVFGKFAGPESDQYTPKASEKDPLRHYRRQDRGAFDVNSLAPQPPKRYTPSRMSPYKQQPSPDNTDEEDFDAMETDYQPVMRSSFTSSQPNALRPRSSHYTNGMATSTLSFNGGLGNEVYSMDAQLRADQDRKRAEQEQLSRSFTSQREASPFYGKLPAAPMSMERRLRNPALRPAEPQKVPLSSQKDFMAQMRAGIKPVQFPQKGSDFELQRSNWVLPGDQKEIGIEERFGQTFSLEDPVPAGSGKKGGVWGLLGL